MIVIRDFFAIGLMCCIAVIAITVYDQCKPIFSEAWIIDRLFLSAVGALVFGLAYIGTWIV